MFKWSSLPLTDTVNQAGDFLVNQQPILIQINNKKKYCEALTGVYLVYVWHKFHPKRLGFS